MSLPQPHHQLILFGPPGTSKSRQARHRSQTELGATGDRIIPVTFHPDYSYGEFVARLLPISKDDGRIHYGIHAGPFIRALAMAYRHRAAGKDSNIVLLIDEINRGNCAGVFGDVFQLLDRDEDGWSSYEISVSELIITALKAELRRTADGVNGAANAQLDQRVDELLKKNQLRLPPNFHLIGTMNTSDESVYFMDSAFKRRWHFKFHSVDFSEVPAFQGDANIAGTTHRWSRFIDALNEFIIDTCASPTIDDKLVGPWFIKARRQNPTIPTIEKKFARECEVISENAENISTRSKGADFSRKFEDEVIALANRLPATLRQEVLVMAGHESSKKPDKERVFGSIETKEVTAGYPFYLLKSLSPTKLDAARFIAKLKNFPAEEPRYEVDFDSISGKLMFYLWDNVFDRDKSPLAALLLLEPRSLKTFGQFSAQAKEFVDRICARTSAAPVAP